MTSVKIKDNLADVQRRYVKRDVSAEKTYIQLDRNENPFGYSPEVRGAIAKSLEKITRYPDLYAESLVDKLAAFHNIPVENITTGNGSFELINTIAEVFLNPGDEVISSFSTFDWYRTASVIANGNVIEVPLDEDYGISLDNMINAITAKTKIIWVCNPNNPTGTVHAEEEIRKFIEAVPSNILVVLDEAYIDFVREIDGFDSVGLVKEYNNVILLRTFSKIYGLASLRIGYAISNEYFITAIRLFKTPMSTNFIAVEAAKASLDDKAFYHYTKEQTAKQLDYFYREFDKLGLPYIRSNANFLMVDILRDSAEFVRLLKDNNILIRGGAEFAFPTWVRITVGTEEENSIVIKILTSYLSKFQHK